ncbi:MAG: alpha/beta fold hydrolase [Steroidobacteraceae bacterium]
MAALSPDGSRLAVVKSTQDNRTLAVISLDDEKLLLKAALGDAKLRALQWIDNDRLVTTTASSKMPFRLSGEAVEWNLLTLFDVKAAKARPLLDRVNGDTPTMNVTYGPLVVQHHGDDTLLYVHGYYITDQTTPGLFRINLRTGNESLIKQGEARVDEWVIDDNGEVVADYAYQERPREWSIDLYHKGRRWQKVSGIAPIDAPEILGLTPEGAAVVVAVTEPTGRVWRPLSITDGTWGQDIAPDEAMTDLIYKNGSRRMIGTEFIGDTTRYHFSDPQQQEAWDWTERVFSYQYQRVEFVCASDDFSRILVRVMGGKYGYAYYLADFKEHRTRKVGDVYTGLAQIAEMRPIKYKAADGLEIPAYLTLPPGRPEKNLPVIVMPHGGPEEHDVQSFDWWAQALAAQGYAVLQPNYRGSDLNLKWVEGGYGQWGRKMQTDLSDGLHDLVARGIADPARACIVGASYGGYAALAGVTLQSGIYRCAIAVAGVSDLSNMLYWVERAEGPGPEIVERYWLRFLDVSAPGDHKLDAISPLRHADQLSVPLLLIHGRDDVTVPYAQSADMAKSLKRAGKPVEFVTLEKEDHYMSRSATRLQMLQSSVEFLRKYNPPD